MLEQYPISDILEWLERKKLVLNPDFWTDVPSCGPFSHLVFWGQNT